MQFDPAQYRRIFCDEAAEHLATLEAALLRLEARPDDFDAVDEAFRAAHSVKGGADATGFPHLARFTHGVEELLGRFRVSRVVTRRGLDLLLEATDALARLVAACKTGEPPAPGIDALLARLKAESDATSARPPAAGVEYAVRVTPSADAFRSGLDPLTLLRELATLGTVERVELATAPPALSALDPETCYLSWSMVLRTEESADAIADVFAFAREKIRVEIEPRTDVGSRTATVAGSRSQSDTASTSGIRNPMTTTPSPDPVALAMSLVERGVLTADQVLDGLNRRRLKRPMLGGLAVQLGYLTQDVLFETLAEMENGQPFGQIALRAGRLTEEQLGKLVMLQEQKTPALADVLVATGMITRGVMDDELKAYRSEAAAVPAAMSHFAEIPDPELPPPPDLSVLDEYGPMIGEFCGEADEHLESADRQLLIIDVDPTNAEALNAVYRGFHTIKGVSSMLGLGVVQTLAHEAENLLNLAREGKVLLKGTPLDLVFVSTDALKRQIRYIRKWAADRGQLQEDPAIGILLADLRAAVGGTSKPRCPKATMSPHESRVIPPPAKSPPRAAPPPAAAPVGVAPPERAESPPTAKADGQPAARQGAPAKETVRVDTDRLDKLINTIGELVIAQSMAQREFDELNAGSGVLSLALPELSKISRDLQELSLSLRMVPVQSTFQKMARLVRDLSRKMDKPVEFALHGEETELDKTVVDQLGDPLMHMVRNAIDHGLEDPAERLAAGKPAAGHVSLKAFHQGGSIYIELSDDGKGMDRERLIRKAVEKGLIPEGQRLTDAEAYALIFAPGFSTAKAVTDVSGRGVGMDVVRRNVEALQGNIHIATQLGKGTTFTIRLPLTLAIMDGLMVGLGEDVYVLPLLSVVESFRPRRCDVHAVAARGEAVTARGEVVPLLRLHALLGRPARVTDPCLGLVVLVEDQGRKYAVLIDELLGQMQAVVKSLDVNYRRIEGLAGATILGDGRVAMILDIHGLAQLHAQAGGGRPPAPAADTPHTFLGDLT